MNISDTAIPMTWTGPFSWPGYEDKNHLPAIPSGHGVYIWTAEYKDGYILYLAGYTRAGFLKRLKAHTTCYKKGEYNILDIDDMSNGIRNQIWHGWRERPTSSPQRMQEWLSRQDELQPVIERQLTGYRVFLADLQEHQNNTPNVHGRLEGAVMRSLAKQPPPLCDIMDKGMALQFRKKSQDPVLIKNICDHKIHGLPESMTI